MGREGGGCRRHELLKSERQRSVPHTFFRRGLRLRARVGGSAREEACIWPLVLVEMV